MKFLLTILGLGLSSALLADATIFNSDGSSSSVYSYDNGDAMILNSDGSSSTVYSYDNGDAMILNSDGSSSMVYGDD